MKSSKVEGTHFAYYQGRALVHSSSEAEPTAATTALSCRMRLKPVPVPRHSAHAVMLIAFNGLHMGQSPMLTLIGC